MGDSWDERSDLQRLARRLALTFGLLYVALAALLAWELRHADQEERGITFGLGLVLAAGLALAAVTVRQIRVLWAGYRAVARAAADRAEQLAAERRRAEQRRAAQLAAARVLSGAPSFDRALPGLLAEVGAEMGFEAGRAWVPRGGRISAAASWARTLDAAAPLAEGGPLTPDPAAAREAFSTSSAVLADLSAAGPGTPPGGYRTALAFPLVAGGEVVAVLELLSGELPRPADGLAAAAQELGGQIGGFVDRLRSSESLAQAERRRAEELERAVSARDQFLSIASHELKTPLTSMQLQLQSLARAVGTESGGPERLAQKLRAVVRSSERLAELVNRLLDVSQISAGSLAIVREDLDLAELAREVAGRFAETLAESGSRLEVSAPAPVRGRWDRMRVDAIVTNLLSNAIKYGEGRPIDLGVAAEDGLARLWVKDRGIGVAAADQARIFERFERAVPERHYGGFGVGLWVARLVAEAHGGRIRVESRPGEGSTFTLELPREGWR